ncbi:MAG: DUF5702 domain-containing protein [Oscillospiraceae bacterium]|nr:DUF5702 domain-containing protein [Oscillospiraceae bacterium]
MRGFIKNVKGAVTVFITLLLIPAMLVSGTAVDLARIHTARSIIQDANQLAANAVLSQYDALLKDLYGLFGVAEDDPVLGSLLDDYIKVSVFGESGQDKSLGTLQLFYGSNISSAEPVFADGKNLRNADVLQRQIEDYMKFRGPVIIVQDILELLGSGTFKTDSGIINDKLDVESAIADIYEKYKELYTAITAADKCDQVGAGIAGYTVGTVSSALERLKEEFKSLRACYEAWEKAVSMNVKNDLAAKYKAILSNIRILTIGGSVGSSWSNGRWTSFSGSLLGLNKRIENAKDNSNRFKDEFDAVVSIAIEIDGMKNELKQKIDNLEQRLKNENINDDLLTALTEKTGTPAKSIIERYRDIVSWDSLEEMSNIYSDNGYYYIDEIMKPYLDEIIYRNAGKPSDASLTRLQLENITSNPALFLSENVEAEDSLAAVFAKANVTYGVPPGFLKFANCSQEHKAFFDELFNMMNQPVVSPVKLYDGQKDASGSNSEAKQRSMINDLLNLVNTAYDGMANNPLGAKHINNSAGADANKLNMKDITKIIPRASNEPVASVISDPEGAVIKAADYLLLLSYCASVFSDYTSARPESNGKTRADISALKYPKSVTGVPLSPEVNYFFQSELEYIYNGSQNASANLSAVSRLIFIVRLICNYITVFSVRDVTMVITSIRTAFAWNPPLALLLGELARAAFVAAESAVDVATLRAGYNLPLIKKGRSGEWVCSPSGIAKAMADIGTELISSGNENNSNEKGLSYLNYIIFFFLAKGLVSSDASYDMLMRTADLIEWNVINYRNGIFSDEGKMAGALAGSGSFKLIDMKTDFSITTTVDMKMLFLSMFFSQKFSASNGLGMPGTMPVEVTDHRGY